MAQAVFSIGSNLGERENNVREALNRLERALGTPPAALSPIVNTKAWGFSAPDFLNCVVSFETEKDPYELLGICKEIERSMGRHDEPEFDASHNRIYHDRIIDIDILSYGNLKIDTPDLKIPHPQVETRDYIKELLLNLQAK
ncbi:MAG: 2-amino-4-hydroxy-6-hydroxymethyldihydropteridine diphosphokinase [Bacteroidales bacterium]|nr:2-amino-4-hydroxy-6-hydroxymethyldihydropteridine diphosphokinase [Bacteroidales bacterium]